MHTETLLKRIEEVGRSGSCYICRKPNSYNVCIECDAIVTARQSYKRYYRNKLYLEKHTENTFKRDKQIRYYYDEAKQYYTSVGIEGLNKEDLQKFWSVFNGEFKKLNDNFVYMCKVLQFNTDKQLFSDNINWCDELKNYYRLSPKVYEDETDVPF